MLSISIANSAEDFEAAGRLCRALGDWDAATHQANGIAPEIVAELFHGQTSASLAERFAAPHAALLLARWDKAPAGCVAFENFEDTAHEIHKFYVDPAFRRKGIGSGLMQAVLAEIEARKRKKIVLQTSLYMPDAIAVYRSFGFLPCEPFHPVPDILSATEIFMSRPI